MLFERDELKNNEPVRKICDLLAAVDIVELHPG